MSGPVSTTWTRDGQAPAIDQPVIWADGTWIALDTETTGVDVTTDRIVTATIIVRPAGGHPLATTWLADPGVDIPAAATAVHTITTEHAQEHGRPASEVVAEVAEFLGQHWSADVPLLGYNLAYDLSLLDAEMQRHLDRRLVTLGPVVDGLVLDKHVDRYRKGSRKLVAVCEHYGVHLHGAHDATEDALAAARVIWRIAHRYPAEVGTVGLAELHQRQRVWFAEQQVSFAEYLRREAEEMLTRSERVKAEADYWPMRGASL